MRYELHRVWVVEAKLKAGQRHINSRRTFYLDEDSWQIVVHRPLRRPGRRCGAIPRRRRSTTTKCRRFWTTLETHHDLKSGRYIAGLLDNEDKPRDFSFQSTPATTRRRTCATAASAEQSDDRPRLHGGAAAFHDATDGAVGARREWQ